MTTDEIITDVLEREGGWRDAVQRPDGTWDPATNKGITLPVLRAWRLRQNAHANAIVDVGDLRNLSDAEAEDIYVEEYITKPGFTPANIPYEPLRVQLIDFGINSGPATAVRWLQRVVSMLPHQIDGVIGPETRWALTQIVTSTSPERAELRWRLINDALVAARSYMIDRAVDTGRMRKADEEGVESRALSFFLAKPAP